MIDLDGLNSLVADLDHSPIKVQAGARKAVEKAAKNGAANARRLAPRRYLPHYADTITHEAAWEKGAAVGEFGPEARGQGNLGAILEQGTAKSPPQAHIGPAFDLEQPEFIDDLGDIDLL